MQASKDDEDTINGGGAALVDEFDYFANNEDIINGYVDGQKYQNSLKERGSFMHNILSPTRRLVPPSSEDNEDGYGSMMRATTERQKPRWIRSFRNAGRNGQNALSSHLKTKPGVCTRHGIQTNNKLPVALHFPQVESKRVPPASR